MVKEIKEDIRKNQIRVSTVFKAWLNTQKYDTLALGNKFRRKEFYEEVILRCLSDKAYVSYMTFKLLYKKDRHK